MHYIRLVHLPVISVLVLGVVFLGCVCLHRCDANSSYCNVLPVFVSEVSLGVPSHKSHGLYYYFVNC